MTRASGSMRVWNSSQRCEEVVAGRTRSALRLSLTGEPYLYSVR